MLRCEGQYVVRTTGPDRRTYDRPIDTRSIDNDTRSIWKQKQSIEL